MLFVSNCRQTSINNINIYEHEDLTPGNFIMHKIIEQPGWLLLLVLIIWLVGLIELFSIKGKENDLSYQLKGAINKETKSASSAANIAQKIPLIREITSFSKFVDKQIETLIEKSQIKEDKREILKTLVYFVFLRIISAVLKSGAFYLSIKIGSQWITQITDAIFYKIQNLSPAYFEEQDSIGLLSKNFETSISALKNVITKGSRVVKSFIEVFITFISFCQHSKTLGAITAFWIAIHVAVCCTYVQPAREANNTLAYLEGKQMSFISERLRNKHIETFLNLKKNNIIAFQGITHKIREITDDLAKPSSLLLIYVFVLATILQVGIFNFFLIRHSSIFGKNKAIIFASNLMLISCIYDMSIDIPKIIESSVQIPKIFTIINDPKNQERKRENLEIDDEHPEIEADNLSLSNGDRIIFENLSFKIPYGSQIAVVGASGSGKTTFVNMVSGLNEKYTGSIKIGGKDVREISRDSLEKNIGYMFSSQTLLSGSLRENIARKHRFSDETIKNILKKCELEYLLDKISLDTPLGEGEGILSSGEKKRVMIAMALPGLPKKKIAILDETLSNLDSTTATIIYEMIQPYIKGKTVFFIDHSGLLPKDTVFFFPKNRRMIIGQHEILMNEDEEYRSMMENSPFTNTNK